MSVLANVELAPTISGVSKTERRKKAISALEKVGLGDQLYKKPNQMSGGQMQRVAIARALVNDPEILLCDEPTQAVDVSTRTEIHRLLRDKTDGGAGVLYVSSDLPELLETADRILIVSCGRTEECLENQALTAQQVLARCYEYQEKEARP